MKVAIVLGTRPEIIKMSPIIRECSERGTDYFIIHTGQHYDYKMDKIFFKDLELSPESVNLNVGSGSHSEVTAKALIGIEKELIERKPDIVLVQGDTNTVLAGALAAAKLGIPVGHVEAGLRSYDERMPEELNRKLTDHISSFLFVPTSHAKEIALKEGIDEKKVFVTGNTIVDAVMQNMSIANKKSNVHKDLGIEGDYFLVTAHRQENVDSRDTLESIMYGLGKLYGDTNIQMVYPIHPRTKKRIEEFSLSIPEGIRLIDPVGFLDFLKLESKAKLILTDSGGVQEESCILKVPCVTLRISTERPETVSVGANIIAGTAANSIFNKGKEMLTRKRDWENPLGDGTTGKQIIDILENHFKEKRK